MSAANRYVERVVPRRAWSRPEGGHGHGLTWIAAHGRSPVVGRDREITALVRTLAGAPAQSPVLVGEQGVGKTAIAEGLAQRIAAGQVPGDLQTARVASLDLRALAPNGCRREFGRRLHAVLEELAARDSILLINGLDVLATEDASPTSRPATRNLLRRLSRGELRGIGEATPGAYHTHVENNSALRRQFRPIDVTPASAEDTVCILHAVRHQFGLSEGAHSFPQPALVAAAALSDRYLPRNLPAKAIDLLRDVTAVHDRAELDEHSVAEVVSKRTGVPLSQLLRYEDKKLFRLEQALHSTTESRGDVIRTLATAIRRRRLGVSADGRRAGSFLLLGPNCPGRVELGRALAEALFDGDESLVHIDLSNYQDAPAETGPGSNVERVCPDLASALMRRPESVVILETIESAHPELFDALLQVLETHRVVDHLGCTVDCGRAIFVVTSDLGGEVISEIGLAG